MEIKYQLLSKNTDEFGVENYLIDSPFQPEANTIRVVLPQNFIPRKTIDVLFVLPVEEKLKTHYGDGLLTVKETNFHNQHNFVLVAPSFSQLPWYTDHSANHKTMQETYFIESVLPFVEEIIKAKKLNAYLLGFSKSGWGALSLLNRHPQIFSGISIWDAPLTATCPASHNSSNELELESFDLKKMAEENLDILKKKKNIAITGYDFFRKQMLEYHYFLNKLAIEHFFEDGPRYKHVWGSGWVERALSYIIEMK